MLSLHFIELIMLGDQIHTVWCSAFLGGALSTLSATGTAEEL